MSHTVFISYSKDPAPATQVCDHLERNGVSCWMAPRDIPAGVEYGGAITRALRDSRVLVLLFSAEANESPQVVREVKAAAAKGLPILTIRLAPVSASDSMDYYLGGFQWIDAVGGDLDAHLERITRDVKAILGKAADLPGREPVPSSASTRLQRKVDRLMDEAEALEGAGDFIGAAEKYDEVLELVPQDAAVVQLKNAAVRKAERARTTKLPVEAGRPENLTESTVPTGEMAAAPVVPVPAPDVVPPVPQPRAETNWGLSDMRYRRIELVSVFGEHGSRVWDVAFDPMEPGAPLVASAGKDNKVVVREVDPEGRCLQSVDFATANDVNCVRASPNADLLAYCDDDGIVWLTDGRRTGQFLHRGVSSYVRAVAFHPTVPLLFAASESRGLEAIGYWLDETGIHMVSRWNREGRFRSMAISRTGDWLVLGSALDRQLDVIPLVEGVPQGRTTLKPGVGTIYSVDIHPTLPIAAIGDSLGSVRLVRLDEPGHRMPVLARNAAVWGCRFTPCGDFVVFSDGKGLLGVWNRKDGKVVFETLNGERNDDVYGLAVSPDGRFIATGSWDNKVRLWKVQDPGAGAPGTGIVP